MKRSNKVILTFALTVGVIGGVAAYGKHHYGDPTKLAEHMVEHVSDELDLNATQARSLQTLADELLQLKSEMVGDRGVQRETLRKLIAAPSFDKGKALAMVNAKTAAIERNAPAVLAAMGNFLDGLTSEQRAEIAAHMEKRSRHHRHHHRDHADAHESGRDEQSLENHHNDKDKS